MRALQAREHGAAHKCTHVDEDCADPKIQPNETFRSVTLGRFRKSGQQGQPCSELILCLGKCRARHRLLTSMNQILQSLAGIAASSKLISQLVVVIGKTRAK